MVQLFHVPKECFLFTDNPLQDALEKGLLLVRLFSWRFFRSFSHLLVVMSLNSAWVIPREGGSVMAPHFAKEVVIDDEQRACPYRYSKLRDRLFLLFMGREYSVDSLDPIALGGLQRNVRLPHTAAIWPLEEI